MTEHTLGNQKGHRHEETDANIRGVTITGIVMAVAIVVALLVVFLTIRGFTRFRPIEEPAAFSSEPQTPPEPRLQNNPEMDLTRMRAAENAILDSYGWVDQGKGVARIPIGRAIELLGDAKLPAREGGAVATQPTTGAASGGPQTGPPVEKPPGPNPSPPQGVQP